MLSLAPRGENWWEEESSESKGEGGGPGPPQNALFLRLSFVASFSLVRNCSGAAFLCSFFCFSYGVLGGPTMTGSVGLRPGKRICKKSPPPLLRQWRSRCHSPSGRM